MKRTWTTGVFSLFIIIFISACIDLEPDTATNPVGRPHTITAFLDEAMGPIPGTEVTFEVISGPNAGKVSVPGNGECFPVDCRTNLIGTVTWTYASQIMGTDMVVGSFLDMNVEPVVSDPVEIIWISRIPTLNTWGLLALVVFIGAVAILAFRKIKVSE